MLCNEKWSNKIAALSILEIVTPQDISCCVKRRHKILNTTSVLNINTYHLTLEGGWLETKNVTEGLRPLSTEVIKKHSSVCVTRLKLWWWINVVKTYLLFSGLHGYPAPTASCFFSFFSFPLFSFPLFSFLFTSYVPYPVHWLFLKTSPLCLSLLPGCWDMGSLFWPQTPILFLIPSIPLHRAYAAATPNYSHCVDSECSIGMVRCCAVRTLRTDCLVLHPSCTSTGSEILGEWSEFSGPEFSYPIHSVRWLWESELIHENA